MRPTFILIFHLSASALLLACGTSDQDLPSKNPEQVDCFFLTQAECHTTCMPFVAHIYDEVEQCYEREPTFISCEPPQGTLNTTTLARHVDGRCAEFPSTELPSNGQWTEDEECNELLTEKGVCE
jgi:hypothetical protein